MVNTNKLRGKVVEKALSVSELADKIGINRATFYRKLNGNGATFSIKESDMIAKELELTKEEAISIFFSQFVADMRKQDN